MDVAFANVDLLAENLPDWYAFEQKQTLYHCGLTAGKAGFYQHSTKRKRRRIVPANWVYYIQSAYSFQ